MANIITKEHAETIARKLKAVRVSGKKKSGGGREHEIAVIYFDGMEIASFGIRHGSNKEAPHGHLIESLHVTPHQCRQLADCPMKLDQWVAVMREKGLLPQPPEVAPPQAEQPRTVVRRHGTRRRKKDG